MDFLIEKLDVPCKLFKARAAWIVKAKKEMSVRVSQESITRSVYLVLGW